MGQTITEYVGFLAKARQAVEELSLLKDREEQLIQDERRLERELETYQKRTEDIVQQTIRRRLEEIHASYDSSIGKSQERLKKARQKRERAKTQGVRARIKEETEELRLQNEELKSEMKVLFQQHQVPAFCRSGCYYSLYFPRRLKEFLGFLLWLGLCFAVIPCGIYYLIPNHRPWYLAVIYVLAILIFGGMYVLLGNLTRLRHPETLSQGRTIRDTIQSNRRKIRVITAAVRRDRDEARYDLAQYDDEIALIDQELAEVTGKKRDAVNTFHQVTRTILTDEIEESRRSELEQLQADYHTAAKALSGTEQQIKEKNLEVTDLYEPFLGREFLDALKIAELSARIQDGSAANLTEAIKLFHENKKQ